MFAVGTLSQLTRRTRHTKVLEELDAAADGGVALGEIAPGALAEPFGEGGAGGQGVDPRFGLEHVHCFSIACCLQLLFFSIATIVKIARCAVAQREIPTRTFGAKYMH